MSYLKQSLISEATYAQSPADFISKLSIALKECNDTLYWLNILKDTEYLNEKEFESMNTDCEELLALIISSIKTTKQQWKVIVICGSKLFTIHFYPLP